MTEDSEQVTAACRECGARMDPHRNDPCPSCGKVGTKLVDRKLTAITQISASLSWESTREFWEKNRLLYILGIILFVADIIVNVLLLFFVSVAASIICLAVSIVLGLSGLVLGPYAATKVRERRSGSS